MLRRLWGTLVGGPGPTRTYECRNCGTSVRADEGTCPTCDSDEIARYDV